MSYRELVMLQQIFFFKFRENQCSKCSIKLRKEFHTKIFEIIEKQELFQTFALFFPVICLQSLSSMAKSSVRQNCITLGECPMAPVVILTPDINYLYIYIHIYKL